MPVLQVFMHPLIARMPISLLGVLVAIGKQVNDIVAESTHIELNMLLAHQVMLKLGLSAYLMHAPRLGILSANKEGLVSLPGLFIWQVQNM